MTKTKKIRNELKEKGYFVREHTPKERKEQLAKENDIELTCSKEAVKEGWLGKSKGLLQVLWERGWIDELRLGEYTLKGTKNQLDKEGNILPEHRRFVLCSLMKECADFQEEKSAMEMLLDGLSAKSSNDQSIKLLVSPKYYCELAGEGVEYVWSMAKRFYQSCALEKKNTKHKFNRVVRAAVEHVSKKEYQKNFSMMPTIHDGLPASMEGRRTYARDDQALREGVEDAPKHQ